MAIGLLASTGQLETGVLPIDLELRKQGIKGIILPRENGKEAAMVEGIDVCPTHRTIVNRAKEFIEFR